LGCHLAVLIAARITNYTWLRRVRIQRRTVDGNPVEFPKKAIKWGLKLKASAWGWCARRGRNT
jgi:hypothetical protein